MKKVPSMEKVLCKFCNDDRGLSNNLSPMLLYRIVVCDVCETYMRHMGNMAVGFVSQAGLNTSSLKSKRVRVGV
jgi:hypothetical protein